MHAADGSLFLLIARNDETALLYSVFKLTSEHTIAGESQSQTV